MILMHKSLKRSDNLMRSFRNFCDYNFKTLDGVIEVFINRIGQGFLLKMLETYGRDKDLVVWFFESLSENNIQVGFSNYSNLDEHNGWIDKEKVNFKVYPIKTNIKQQIISDIHEIIKEYYGLNEEIEIPKGLSI